jgi:hypothetical protein
MLALTLLAAAARAERLRVVVPAYQYPTLGTLWADLAAAAPRVPLVAILNPDNGPGAVADPNYVAAVNAVRAAGGKVYGYVYTHYTARGADTVLADAARYPRFYPIDGVFVDELTADASPAHLAYYAGLVAGLHDSLPGLPVMGNPGINCDAGYVNVAHFDELLTFEHHAGYDTWLPESWMAAQPPSRFVNLVYARHGAAGMLEAIRQAAHRNVASVYVTDDSLPNPWDTLPPYWATEVAVIETTAVAASAVSVPGRPAAMVSMALSPNPARGAVTFRLAAATHARTLLVLDAQGRRVQAIALPAGATAAAWDGRIGGGRPAPAGLYLAAIAGSETAARRFTLLR